MEERPGDYFFQILAAHDVWLNSDEMLLVDTNITTHEKFKIVLPPLKEYVVPTGRCIHLD